MLFPVRIETNKLLKSFLFTGGFDTSSASRRATQPPG